MNNSLRGLNTDDIHNLYVTIENFLVSKGCTIMHEARGKNGYIKVLTPKYGALLRCELRLDKGVLSVECDKSSVIKTQKKSSTASNVEELVSLAESVLMRFIGECDTLLSKKSRELFEYGVSCYNDIRRMAEKDEAEYATLRSAGISYDNLSKSYLELVSYDAAIQSYAKDKNQDIVGKVTVLEQHYAECADLLRHIEAMAGRSSVLGSDNGSSLDGNAVSRGGISAGVGSTSPHVMRTQEPNVVVHDTSKIKNLTNQKNSVTEGSAPISAGSSHGRRTDGHLDNDFEKDVGSPPISEGLSQDRRTDSQGYPDDTHEKDVGSGTGYIPAGSSKSRSSDPEGSLDGGSSHISGELYRDTYTDSQGRSIGNAVKGAADGLSVAPDGSAFDSVSSSMGDTTAGGDSNTVGEPIDNDNPKHTFKSINIVDEKLVDKVEKAREEVAVIRERLERYDEAEIAAREARDAAGKEVALAGAKVLEATDVAEVAAQRLGAKHSVGAGARIDAVRAAANVEIAESAFDRKERDYQEQQVRVGKLSLRSDLLSLKADIKELEAESIDLEVAKSQLHGIGTEWARRKQVEHELTDEQKEELLTLEKLFEDVKEKISRLEGQMETRAALIQEKEQSLSDEDIAEMESFISGDEDEYLRYAKEARKSRESTSAAILEARQKEAKLAEEMRKDESEDGKDGVVEDITSDFLNNFKDSALIRELKNAKKVRQQVLEAGSEILERRIEDAKDDVEAYSSKSRDATQAVERVNELEDAKSEIAMAQAEKVIGSVVGVAGTVAGEAIGLTAEAAALTTVVASQAAAAVTDLTAVTAGTLLTALDGGITQKVLYVTAGALRAAGHLAAGIEQSLGETARGEILINAKGFAAETEMAADAARLGLTDTEGLSLAAGQRHGEVERQISFDRIGAKMTHTGEEVVTSILDALKKAGVSVGGGGAAGGGGMQGGLGSGDGKPAISGLDKGFKAEGSLLPGGDTAANMASEAGAESGANIGAMVYQGIENTGIFDELGVLGEGLRGVLDILLVGSTNVEELFGLYAKGTALRAAVEGLIGGALGKLSSEGFLPQDGSGGSITDTIKLTALKDSKNDVKVQSDYKVASYDERLQGDFSSRADEKHGSHGYAHWFDTQGDREAAQRLAAQSGPSAHSLMKDMGSIGFNRDALEGVDSNVAGLSVMGGSGGGSGVGSGVGSGGALGGGNHNHDDEDENETGNKESSTSMGGSGTAPSRKGFLRTPYGSLILGDRHSNTKGDSTNGLSGAVKGLSKSKEAEMGVAAKKRAKKKGKRRRRMVIAIIAILIALSLLLYALMSLMFLILFGAAGGWSSLEIGKRFRGTATGETCSCGCLGDIGDDGGLGNWSGVAYVTDEMLSMINWNGCSADELNALLEQFGVTHPNSIMALMASTAAESSFGRAVIEGMPSHPDNSDSTPLNIIKNPNGTPYQSGYMVGERGAGYIQLTWRGAHMSLLSKIGDTYTGDNTARYIADNYPAISAVYWFADPESPGNGNFRHQMGITDSSVTMNTYMASIPELSIGAYAMTQSALNGGQLGSSGRAELKSHYQGGTIHDLTADDVAQMYGESYRNNWLNHRYGVGYVTVVGAWSDASLWNVSGTGGGGVGIVKSMPTTDVDVTGVEITFIGDSIGNALQPELASKVGSGSLFDSVDGRTLSQGKTVLDGLLQFDNVKDVVVLELGTNALSIDFDVMYIEDMIASLTEKSKVILVTPYMASYYTGSDASTMIPIIENTAEWMRNAKATYPNVSVVDWNQYVKDEVSGGRTEADMLTDGVHLTTESYTVLAEMIASSLGGSVSVSNIKSNITCSCSTDCMCWSIHGSIENTMEFGQYVAADNSLRMQVDWKGNRGSNGLDLASLNEMFFGVNTTNYIQASPEHLVTIQVSVWDYPNQDVTAEKITRQQNLQVHRLVADEVKTIFEEIYNSPEQPVIHNNTTGGFRNGTSNMHPRGLAIDISHVCNLAWWTSGEKAGQTVGNYWAPQGLPEDAWVNPKNSPLNHDSTGCPYSIHPDGAIAQTFKRYGWCWGGDIAVGTNWCGEDSHWRTVHDYMHFSWCWSNSC